MTLRPSGHKLSPRRADVRAGVPGRLSRRRRAATRPGGKSDEGLRRVLQHVRPRLPHGRDGRGRGARRQRAEVALSQVPKLTPEAALERTGAKKAREAFAHVPVMKPDADEALHG